MPVETLARWAYVQSHTDPVFLDALLTRSEVARGIDFDRSISEIACPILLLQADLSKGGAMEDDDVDLFCRNARYLEVVYFEGIGHGIHDERPAQAFELLDTFAQKFS